MSEKWDVLHSLQDYRISTHTKIVVGAPNLDFIGDLRGVGRRETGREAVDVVKVTVRLVLMLLVKLLLVELFVVEAAGRLRRLALLGCGSNGLLRGGRRLGLSLRLSGMEGTSPSLLGRLLLGGGGGGDRTRERNSVEGGPGALIVGTGAAAMSAMGNRVVEGRFLQSYNALSAAMSSMAQWAREFGGEDDGERW